MIQDISKACVFAPATRGQQREPRILNSGVRWEDTGITWEPDPRHTDIMIEQTGLKDARLLRIPGVKEEKKSERELRADIDNIIDQNKTLDRNGTFDDSKILDAEIVHRQ